MPRAARLKRTMQAAAMGLAAMAAGILAAVLLVSALGIWLAGRIGIVPALSAMGSAAAVVAIILGLVAERTEARIPKPEPADVAKAVLPAVVALLPRIGGRGAALGLSVALVAMAVLLFGSDSAAGHED